VTFVTDLRIRDLVKKLGRDHARAVWDAGVCAIQQIHENIETEKIACDFSRVPGFVHSSLNGTENETEPLKLDAELARELGFDAEFVSEVPVFHTPGVRFANQAIFHPLKYLAKLVARIPGRGSHVFENSDARQFKREGDSVCVVAGGFPISCDYVVIATDVPLTGLSALASAAAFQTKITGYTSYVIGAKLPPKVAPEASFWDTSDPYYYLRINRNGRSDYAIFGGLDHKTGQSKNTKRFVSELKKMLHRYLPEAKVDRSWSGQVIESHDGLPLIGETASRQFISTGFSGNGITFGTLSAIMIRDAIDGRKNPWRELFDPGRKQIRAAWNYLTENLQYPYYLIKDRLAKSEAKSLRSVKRGQGKLLRLKGKRVAAYRDANGRVAESSAICPHMGCIVHWNDVERSWDCPCHGSRFDGTGKLIAGPAESPLTPIVEES
jgi:glycine/D-amino acid oxidase-like deaminating enzyme/nitrite reductase/ring-hydroxylating ferredoxin subunit